MAPSGGQFKHHKCRRKHLTPQITKFTTLVTRPICARTKRPSSEKLNELGKPIGYAHCLFTTYIGYEQTQLFALFRVQKVLYSSKYSANRSKFCPLTFDHSPVYFLNYFLNYFFKLRIELNETEYRFIRFQFKLD